MILLKILLVFYHEFTYQTTYTHYLNKCYNNDITFKSLLRLKFDYEKRFLLSSHIYTMYPVFSRCHWLPLVLYLLKQNFACVPICSYEFCFYVIVICLGKKLCYFSMKNPIKIFVKTLNKHNPIIQFPMPLIFFIFLF